MVKLLSPSDLKTQKGIAYSRSQLHRKIAEGSFPKPIRVGDNKNAWVEDEVDEWIAARITERDKLRPAQKAA
jgi:prophage regulatory protein